jgi:starch phosphorylase
VENFGEQLAQYLVHGVDIWLDNPLPPFEACETSGMKAGPNGVPHLSILDGWYMQGNLNLKKRGERWGNTI